MGGGLRTAAVMIGAVAVSFVPGVIGSRFAPGEWYRGLDRPWFTPPSAAFPIAWTTLYLLMGVALALVVLAGGRLAWRAAVPLFAAQLVLNGAWSWIFFGLHRPAWALVDLALLWLLVAACVVVFWRIRRAAGGLLLPYLAWLTYAGALNLAIVILN